LPPRLLLPTTPHCAMIETEDRSRPGVSKSCHRTTVKLA
jgi:hypothetical protein